MASLLDHLALLGLILAPISAQIVPLFFQLAALDLNSADGQGGGTGSK